MSHKHACVVHLYICSNQPIDINGLELTQLYYNSYCIVQQRISELTDLNQATG